MAVFQNLKQTTFQFIHSNESKYKEHLLAMIEEVEQESAYTLEWEELVAKSVADCVRRIVRGVKSIHEKLSEAVQILIEDPAKYIRQELKERYSLSDLAIEKIEGNWKSEGEDASLFGISQAITMYAKPENVPDADRRWELWRAGGDLLTNVDNLPIPVEEAPLVD